ncbi:hypothetical protein AOLI_G00103400 [Acnodon oligacanthus]
MRVKWTPPVGQSVNCLQHLLANRSTVGVVCGGEGDPAISCFQSGSSAALLEERSRSCAAEGRAPVGAAARWFSCAGRGEEREAELAGNE